MDIFKLKIKKVGNFEFHSFEDLESFVNGDLKLKVK
jgi:hypothetical protein